MHGSPSIVVKDLVLLGGGHSHVAVLKGFGMRPLDGVRVTLVTRDVHTPYSGMLPGLVAGHYTFDETHIDLGPLSAFAGARLIHDAAIGLDLESGRVLFSDRPPIAYDVLSINIGSTPAVRRVPGAAEHSVPVKPINNFTARWEVLRERVRNAAGTSRIAVVGAGVGGIEITLAMQYALRRECEVDGRSPADLEFHVFGAAPQILPTLNARVRRKLTRILEERAVRVHTNARVARVTGGEMELDSGEVHRCDEIVWVTDAGAPDWLGAAGLDVDERGFVRVGATLESTSHPGVFAAGDVAAVVPYPREKAGVFAVRQGRPLLANLRNALTGEPLQPFRPQRQFLSLISTGDRYAIASRGPWAAEGAWVWRWKDRIDRRFMEKYGDLPAMAADGAPPLAEGVATDDAVRELSTIAMRCGGCGAKVGASVLERILPRLDAPSRDEVRIGLDSPDDAAVVDVPAGKSVVHTVDAFRAIVDDPYVFGKIAANHSLGDLFAMGAEPHTALAIVTIPYGLEAKVEETLEQLLRGAIEVFRAENVALIGGHTSEGAELALGFALTGLIDPREVLQKTGLRPGDRLVLTKPIGTGTLFAANMRLKAKGRWIAGAIASMLASNRAAADCLREHGATACTDVTGFGVLGHLVEMTRASEIDAEIDLGELPVLDGAEATARAGILSSLQPQNVRLRRAVANLDEAGSFARYPLLFDPQTSGGLLAGVPADRAEKCVEELKRRGYARASLIGTVRERSDPDGPIRVSA